MNQPESQSRYIEYRNRYNDSLLTIFPDRLPNNMVSFQRSHPVLNIPGRLCVLLKYFSESEYLETKRTFANVARYRTKGSDKCLFLVNDFENKNEEVCNEFLPVPKEAVYLDLMSEVRTVESDVFIVALKFGAVSSDTTDYARPELPDLWRHGYSTGVTANDIEKTIQLWFVIW